MVYHYEMKVNGKIHKEASVGFRQKVISKILEDINIISNDVDSVEIKVIVKRGKGPEKWKK